MTFIVNVEKGQEEFLYKLLKSLDIVTSVEKIEDGTISINNENAELIRERLVKYSTGESKTKTWEDLQNELIKKHGL